LLDKYFRSKDPDTTMAQERLSSLRNQFQQPSKDRKVIPIDYGWLFKQQDGPASSKILRPTASFPTNIHLDLLAHNLIPDPFIGTNETKVQWVGEQTWVYQCSFTIPSKELDKFRYASLTFEGLDTFCIAKLKGEEILRTDNMFISYQIDVRERLTGEKEHILELVFQSATERGQCEMKSHPEHAWGSWNGDASRTAVRKAQYHYVSLETRLIFPFNGSL
jgi:beta-mannosidase